MERIEEKDPSVFDWLTWRRGSIHDLGLACREAAITSDRGKQILRAHAVAWCKSESLLCRPKTGQVALMVEKNGETFWFHIREHEFKGVFGCDLTTSDSTR
jgi:hypothetical protein